MTVEEFMGRCSRREFLQHVEFYRLQDEAQKAAQARKPSDEDGEW